MSQEPGRGSCGLWSWPEPAAIRSTSREPRISRLASITPWGTSTAARDLFNSAIDRFKTLAIPWAIGSALIGLARVAVATGDPARAERLLDEAAPALEHAGPWFLSRALYVRAIMAVQRGAAADAIAFVRDSLTRVRDLQDKYAFAFTLVPLATAAFLTGDDVWAAQILGMRAVISERTGATIVLKMVHDLHAEAERDVRARLGPDRWSAAYGVGQKDVDRFAAGADRWTNRRAPLNGCPR